MKICAGNWKMYKTPDEAAAFLREFSGLAPSSAAEASKRLKFLIFPPALCLDRVASVARELNLPIEFGVQNSSFKKEGALTGETSAWAASQAGASWVLVGHSERREIFRETNDELIAKVKYGHELNLNVLFCFGEKLGDRKRGATESVLLAQLKPLFDFLSTVPEAKRSLVHLAYEPVWAIGTGVVASPDDVRHAHAFIRNYLAESLGAAMAAQTCLLYGGSVKPDNSAALSAIPNVDGFLIGGASLVPSDFVAIGKSLN